MPIDPRQLPQQTQIGLRLIAQWMAQRKAAAQLQQAVQSGQFRQSTPQGNAATPGATGRRTIPPAVVKSVLALLSQRNPGAGTPSSGVH